MMKFPYPRKNAWIFPFELPDVTLLIYRWEASWTGIDKDEITLYQNSKGEFFLKGQPVRIPRNWYGCPNPNPIREVQVSKGWVCYIFKRLEHAAIPAFPAPQMGSDGDFTELEIGGYRGKAHYRWWSIPPQGWEVLAQIAGEIHKKFYHRSLLEKIIPKTN